MRNRIPADVERLMWLVAESNDPAAIKDFETRFPTFAVELAKRLRMVSDLKHAKSNGPKIDRIPVFTPRDLRPTPASRGNWIAGGVALAALAMASFSATTWLTKKPEPLPKPEAVVTKPVDIPNQTVKVPVNPPQQAPIVPNPRQEPVVSVPPSNNETLKTLRLSNTSLLAALKLIGEMAGYRVDVAPGLQDEQISIDYDQVTTSEMLRDLGSRYGFTPFDQGDGTIIIVPAVDQGPPASSPNNSSRRIG
jgi:hypothetical protein